MLFVFLDFNINAGRSTIGLIPDFIGYIIMIKGLAELGEESVYFAKAKGFAKGMAVYTAILYVMDLIGFTRSIGIGAFLFGLVSIAISLYISNCIVKGVEELENIHNTYLNADSLYSVWKVYAGFTIATYVLILVPLLNIICILVSLIAAIVFLVSFSKSKRLYYSPWQ